MEKYRNKTIVFFGDSITDSGRTINSNYPYGAGYVNMIHSEIDVWYHDYNINIINEGISAHRTDHLLERFTTSITAHKPDLVVLFIGINDVWHPYDRNEVIIHEEIMERFDLLVNKIKELNSEILVLVPFLFPREPHKEFFDGLMPHYQVLYNNYLNYLTQNKIDYIDLQEVMTPYNDLSLNTSTKDSVHPDILGHSVIAQAVMNWLNKQ